MSTAQVVFSIALAVVGLIITWFSFYVVNTTMWGNRWVRARKRATGTRPEEEAS
jgi:uncharacterized protein HemY